MPLDRLKVQDAKPIFVFTAESELAFLRAAGRWAFPIHFTLAKTGLRVGELVHLLIEDVDLDGGWLLVRNKTALGWRVKTGDERGVPLLPEVAAVLRSVIGNRARGPVLLRPRFSGESPPLVGGQRELEHVVQERCKLLGPCATRAEESRIARGVWRDAGAIKPDAVRTSFIAIMKAIGHPESTCPKSWRHSLATLLQDANVDPLIRQQTLGHRPTTGPGLGMTANYTHTRRETQREQIERALQLRPESLKLAGAHADPDRILAATHDHPDAAGIGGHHPPQSTHDGSPPAARTRASIGRPSRCPASAGDPRGQPTDLSSAL